MNIRDLKELIERHQYNSSLIVMECPENYYVADQYINEINLEKRYLSEDEYIQRSSLDFDYMTLDVYKCDKVKFIPPEIRNLVVICKEFDNDDYNEYVATIPKLSDWQIKNYIIKNLKGLADDEINWLCTVTNYDIYRLTNEMNKINIFDSNLQEIIFNLINKENGYYDLNNIKFFDFTNALIKKDKYKISEILYNITELDIEPAAVVNTILKSFKQIIDIQINPNITPQQLGISEKQYYFIRKNNVGLYTDNELIKIYELINSIDYKLKTGYLDYDKIIDYLLINIL